MTGLPFVWENVRCTLAVTEACNLECRHCYIRAEHSRKEAELTPEEYSAIAHELAQLRGQPDTQFFITGGEPLLRHDIGDIIAALSHCGEKVALTTNGLLLTPTIAKQLAKHQVEVAISLDGPSPAIHEYIRGAGTFASAVAAVRLLNTHGIPVTLDSVVCRHNFPYLPNLFRLALELGVRELVLTNVVLIGRAADNRYLLKPVELYELYQTVEKLCQEDSRFAQLAQDNLDAWLPYRTRWPNCGAGQEMIYIASNGDVFPCSNLTQPCFVAGNIRQATLAEIWEESPVLRSLRTIKPVQIHVDCQRCSYTDICHGGCLAEMDRDFSRAHPQCPSFQRLFQEITPKGGQVVR